MINTFELYDKIKAHLELDEHSFLSTELYQSVKDIAILNIKIIPYMDMQKKTDMFNCRIECRLSDRSRHSSYATKEIIKIVDKKYEEFIISRIREHAKTDGRPNLRVVK